MGQAAKLIVDDRQELIRARRIPLLDPLQKPLHIAHLGCQAGLPHLFLPDDTKKLPFRRILS
jgi:hypothetical protein